LQNIAAIEEHPSNTCRWLLPHVKRRKVQQRPFSTMWLIQWQPW